MTFTVLQPLRQREGNINGRTAYHYKAIFVSTVIDQKTCYSRISPSLHFNAQLYFPFSLLDVILFEEVMRTVSQTNDC